MRIKTATGRCLPHRQEEILYEKCKMSQMYKMRQGV